MPETIHTFDGSSVTLQDRLAHATHCRHGCVLYEWPGSHLSPTFYCALDPQQPCCLVDALLSLHRSLWVDLVVTGACCAPPSYPPRMQRHVPPQSTLPHAPGALLPWPPLSSHHLAPHRGGHWGCHLDHPCHPQVCSTVHYGAVLCIAAQYSTVLISGRTRVHPLPASLYRPSSSAHGLLACLQPCPRRQYCVSLKPLCDHTIGTVCITMIRLPDVHLDSKPCMRYLILSACAPYPACPLALSSPQGLGARGGGG
jgi:hypothetical protein